MINVKVRGARGNEQKRLVIVYTGDGKGKTSAAFGNVFRALGHGMRVLVVQFVKGAWPAACGERRSAKRHKHLRIVECGRGFVGIAGDRKPLAEHRQAAQDGLCLAIEQAASGCYDLVVLDEICCALTQKLLSRRAVTVLLQTASAKTHLILTGRGAPRWLIRSADLVTQMKEIKHPFRQGMKASRGIDY
ncbi:MAG: cob(I)yrinic acid a,c-diamide adenosyltransferase [Candidatus Omnitrophota bacterium]